MNELSVSGLVRVEVLTALFAALSAGGAFWAARATRKAAEAQLLRTMLEHYASAAMYAALQTLAAWRRDHGEAFAQEWSEKRKFGPAIQVDEARRLVASYYESADRLHQSGLISKGTLKAAVDNASLFILFAIVEPLERQISPFAETEFIGRLRRLCPDRVQQGVLMR